MFAGYSLLPALSVAQVTPKTKAKPRPNGVQPGGQKAKTTVQPKATAAVKPAAAEFTIRATITGYQIGRAHV